jgi:hypothetical protein
MFIARIGFFLDGVVLHLSNSTVQNYPIQWLISSHVPLNLRKQKPPHLSRKYTWPNGPCQAGPARARQYCSRPRPVPAWPVIPCRVWADASTRGPARHGMFTVVCRHGTAQAWHGPGMARPTGPFIFPTIFYFFSIYFSYFFFHILSYLYHIFYDIFPKFSSHLSYIYNVFHYIIFFLPFFFFSPQISIFMGHMY